MKEGPENIHLAWLFVRQLIQNPYQEDHPDCHDLLHQDDHEKSLHDSENIKCHCQLSADILFS